MTTSDIVHPPEHRGAPAALGCWSAAWLAGACSPDGATGVIEALKNAGMNDVYVIAVDGCRAGYDQVKAGTQSVSIGQSFTNMAIKSLECAKAKLEGKTFEAVNFIPLDVVTKDNVETLPYPEW